MNYEDLFKKLFEQKFTFEVDYTGVIYMEKKQPFNVGDKVTTNYYPNQEKIVRAVLEIYKDSDCESGWRVLADGGEPCACCKRPFGNEIGGRHGYGVDSGWFKKVE